MGGNALKSIGIESRRVNSGEFYDLVRTAQGELADSFHWLEPVKFWHQKPDHGDIDFVGFVKSMAPGKSGRPLWVEEIADGSEGIHWNKPVLSFEFQGVQVDIAARSTDVAAKNYLQFCHYSPIGNTVGRMIKQTGAKWGVDGLCFPVRESLAGDGDLLGEIHLSDNIADVMQLAGLDPDAWEKGFEKQEDIFRFASGSALFNKAIFQFENLDSVSRKRDRLRQDYHQWLAFVEGVPDKYRRPESDEERGEMKAAWFKSLCELFPDADLEKGRNALLDAKQQRKEAGKNFNGKLVAEWTGLSGKQLGGKLTEFRNSLGGDGEYEKWLLAATADGAKKTFMDFMAQTATLPAGSGGKVSSDGRERGGR